MPQIRWEWNTVTDAKRARKRSLRSLMETFLSTALHERNVRPENEFFTRCKWESGHQTSEYKHQPSKLYLPKEIAEESPQEQGQHSQVAVSQKWPPPRSVTSCPLGGQGAGAAKAGTALCFQTAPSPCLSPYTVFLSLRESQTIQFNGIIAARSPQEWHLKGGQVDDHNRFLLLNLAEPRVGMFFPKFLKGIDPNRHPECFWRD